MASNDKQKIDKASMLAFIEELRAKGDCETLARVAVVTVEGLYDIQRQIDAMGEFAFKRIEGEAYKAERVVLDGIER